MRSNIIFGNRVSDSRFAQTLRKWNMPIKPSLLSINATTRAYNYSSNIGTLLDSVNNRTKSSFALLRMIPPIWESQLVFQYFEIVKIYLEFFFNQECIEIFFFLCRNRESISLLLCSIFNNPIYREFNFSFSSSFNFSSTINEDITNSIRLGYLKQI